MHRRVVGEDAPRAVAVVQVEVHHQHGLGEAARPQPPDRDRDVVEDAEAEPGAGLRVVEAAAQVDRDPARAQRQPRRMDRAPRHQPLQLQRALGLHRWHLDAEDAGERVGLLQLVEVLGRVDAQQALERRRFRLGHEIGAQEPGFGQGLDDLLAAQRVHRDPVDALAVAGVVDEREAAAPQPVKRPAGGPQHGAQEAVVHQLDSPTPGRGGGGPALLYW